MSIGKKVILVLAVLLVSSTVCAHPSLRINKERVTVIQGVIRGASLQAASEDLMTYSRESKKPIDIIINSPGGSVVTGFLFINRMNMLKAQGIKFRCFVPEIAASMAFQILMQCDEKILLERSFLLWHRVRINVGGMFGSPMTAPQAEYLASSMQKLDDMILEELVNEMPGISKKVIEYHFEHESLHTGHDLGKMDPRTFIIRRAVPGLFEILDADREAQLAGMQNLSTLDTDRGEIVYQTTRIEVRTLGTK